MQTIPFTKQGYDVIVKERDFLLQDRPKILEHLKKARELGDLKENGYYRATKQRLGFVDGRLRHLEGLIRNASIIEKTAGDSVQIGSSVKLMDGDKEKNYTIVGGYESDPSLGKVSHISPIGKALLGKKLGDTVMVTVPAGVMTYQIKKIV